MGTMPSATEDAISVHKRGVRRAGACVVGAPHGRDALETIRHRPPHRVCGGRIRYSGRSKPGPVGDALPDEKGIAPMGRSYGGGVPNSRASASWSSCAHSPGASPPRSNPPIALRCSACTWLPTAANMRRTWW